MPKSRSSSEREAKDGGPVTKKLLKTTNNKDLEAAAKKKKELALLASDNEWDDYDDDEPLEGNGPTVWVEWGQRQVRRFCRLNGERISTVKWLLIGIAYHIFLAKAIAFDAERAKVMCWLTGIFWAFWVYYKLLKPFVFTAAPCLAIFERCIELGDQISAHPATTPAAYVGSIASAFGYVLMDSYQNGYALTFDRCVSCAGIFVFMGFMVCISKKPSKIRWRPVIWGFMFQYWLGIVVLRLERGRQFIIDFSNVVVRLIEYAYPGAEFVFGFGTRPPNICGMSPIFAFELTCIIYFNAVIFVLYYFNVIQTTLKWFTWFVQKTYSTSATESLIAVSSIFTGLCDAPLLIRAYLEKLTTSELNAIMTACFASVCGSIMPIFISFGACPEYILAASAMSGPGSLASSKILIPEAEESHCVRVEDLEFEDTGETNPVESATNASVQGGRMWLEVCSVLITFVGLMALINGVCGYMGSLVGAEGLTADFFLGYLFFPVAWVMGITDPREALLIGQILGKKITVNEFIAYQNIGIMQNDGTISPRTAMIATYACCGFSNFMCCGVTLAVLKLLVPNRARQVVDSLMYAMVGGSIVSFITACIAGVLIVEPNVCAPKSFNTGCFNVTAAGETLQRMELALAMNPSLFRISGPLSSSAQGVLSQSNNINDTFSAGLSVTGI